MKANATESNKSRRLAKDARQKANAREKWIRRAKSGKPYRGQARAARAAERVARRNHRIMQESAE